MNTVKNRDFFFSHSIEKKPQGLPSAKTLSRNFLQRLCHFIASQIPKDKGKVLELRKQYEDLPRMFTMVEEKWLEYNKKYKGITLLKNTSSLLFGLHAMFNPPTGRQFLNHPDIMEGRYPALAELAEFIHTFYAGSNNASKFTPSGECTEWENIFEDLELLQKFLTTQAEKKVAEMSLKLWNSANGPQIQAEVKTVDFKDCLAERVKQEINNGNFLDATADAIEKALGVNKKSPKSKLSFTRKKELVTN